MQGLVRSSSLRAFAACGHSKQPRRASAVRGRVQRLQRYQKCGKWGHLSGSCSSWLRPRNAHKDRKRQPSSSFDEDQPSLDALSEEPGAASHGSGGVSSEVPGILSRDSLEAAIDLRRHPWAWRRRILGKMGRFCGPAVAIPLADPLMSLVDNVCIARFAGTLELAALAPCALIFSMGYVFNALSVATLSLVAEGVQGGDIGRAERGFSTALILALVSGIAVLILMQTKATGLVAWTGADRKLWPLAVEYLQIRALAAPAVLVTMCAQAALLAQKDSVTPLIVVLMASSVNLLGDYLLIAKYGMGVRGAAYATVGSQILGAAALLATLRLVSEVKPILRIPSRQDLADLTRTLGPMTVIYLFKNFTYIHLQLTATALAPLKLAAHQLLYSLWSLTSFLTVPLEQAALTFLPAAKDELETWELARLLLVIGSCAGIAGGLLSAGLPLIIPSAFTHDVALHPIMRSVLPQVFLAMLLCGCEVSSGGVLVAEKDLNFVVRSMIITFTVSSSALSAVRMCNWGLQGVWWGLCLFFAVRAALSVPRLLFLTLRFSTKAAPAAAS